MYHLHIKNDNLNVHLHLHISKKDTQCMSKYLASWWFQPI